MEAFLKIAVSLYSLYTMYESNARAKRMEQDRLSPTEQMDQAEAYRTGKALEMQRRRIVGRSNLN